MGSPDWARNLGESHGTNLSGEMGNGDHLLLANRIFIPQHVPWTVERTILDMQIEITVPDQATPPSSQWWAAMAIAFAVRVNPDGAGDPGLVFNTPDTFTIMTGMLKLQGPPHTDTANAVTAVWANNAEYQSKGMRKVDPGIGTASVDVDVQLYDPTGMLDPFDGYSYGWVMNTWGRVLYAYS